MLDPRLDLPHLVYLQQLLNPNEVLLQAIWSNGASIETNLHRGNIAMLSFPLLWLHGWVPALELPRAASA